MCPQFLLDFHVVVHSILQNRAPGLGDLRAGETSLLLVQGLSWLPRKLGKVPVVGALAYWFLVGNEGM